MRKINVLLLSAVFVFLAQSAQAIGFDFFSSEEIFFENIEEEAEYESSFGLFDMNNPQNTFEVFSWTEEVGAQRLVSAAEWTPLKTGFGLYYDVHTGGINDFSADYRWFSNSSLNQRSDGTPFDVGEEHVRVSLESKNLLLSFLDDQITSYTTDRDYTDMTVAVISKDIQTIAPVPEPTTILLFGTGLAGLAAVSRRKRK
ncbi:MAG: hypothetical protein CR972_03780 [Candidatus Moraniibacteriota bacterium]|nr:MAG: hypothetical protein CR972_03780 [Candidatus Moranbacteria bacterium]